MPADGLIAAHSSRGRRRLVACSRAAPGRLRDLIHVRKGRAFVLQVRAGVEELSTSRIKSLMTMAESERVGCDPEPRHTSIDACPAATLWCGLHVFPSDLRMLDRPDMEEEGAASLTSPPLSD
jgi:hypothetical protein